jgi:hypothetical protein
MTKQTKHQPQKNHAPKHEEQKLTVYTDPKNQPTAAQTMLPNFLYGVATPLTDSNLDGITCNKEKLSLGDVLLITNTDDKGIKHKCVVVVADKGGMPEAAIDIPFIDNQSPVADELGLEIKHGKNNKTAVEGEGDVAIHVVGNIPEIRHKKTHETINAALTHVNKHLNDSHTINDIKGMLADRGIGSEHKPETIIKLSTIAQEHLNDIYNFKNICGDCDKQNNLSGGLQLAMTMQAKKFYDVANNYSANIKRS